MNGEHLTNGLELIAAGLRALKAVPAVALTLVLITAVGCTRLPLASPDGTVTGSGSGPGTGPGTGTGGGTGTTGSTGNSGPAAANADVLSFQTHLWANIKGTDRCGGGPQANGPAPPFFPPVAVDPPHPARG